MSYTIRSPFNGIHYVNQGEFTSFQLVILSENKQ